MLSKGPTPEQVEGDEAGEDGDMSEKTAGPYYKEEEEVEDEPEAGAEDEEDSLVERRTPRQTDDDEEDNTLSLAQMEEALKPQALEKFATITSLFKKFSKLQTSRMDAMGAGQDCHMADENKDQKQRDKQNRKRG